MIDNDYFLRRANEELEAAGRATSPKASQAHLELANRYLLKIKDMSARTEPKMRPSSLQDGQQVGAII